jgi:tight adherence protein C
MEIADLVARGAFCWSPLTVALLVGLATGLVWLAFAPAGPQREVETRLDGFLGPADPVEEADMRQSFGPRVLMPLLRRSLAILGRLLPGRNAEQTRQMLLQAGEPGGLGALDFAGLRILCALLLGGGYYFLLGRSIPFSEALRNTLIGAVFGYFLPWFWLRQLVRRRQNEIRRSLPDALDMMTVGVEAGLGFESALVKVGERWDNALTRELRRAVAEMRVGSSRDDALRRVAERTGVSDLSTFVAVLIQSNQLGVSIAQVLHGQAAEMRVRRRQRAEELARQAGVKMIFPLAILIFPALMVVIFGPVVPELMSFFDNLGGV